MSTFAVLRAGGPLILGFRKCAKVDYNLISPSLHLIFNLKNKGYINAKTMADGPQGIPPAEVEAMLKTPDTATKDFLFQQTMYRIKDPRKSLPFYNGVLGMTLLRQLHFPAMKFSLYFMGYENPEDIPKDEKERGVWAMTRKATLELTHNWGTENDDSEYHNGNKEPRGFGHIGLLVPDVKSTCERFDKLGVKYVKRPEDGSMKGLAFIQDPDDYWIEIFDTALLNKIG